MAAANVERFTGLGKTYHSARPKPPVIITQFLPQLIQYKEKTDKLERVVDLGCGTGLSTLIWNGYAKEVIGIDPNEDMLQTAKEALKEANIDPKDCDIKFIKGFSSNTGLPDASVDLITCSQALHWMDPTETFKEAHRILKPGGVFAAFDVKFPVTVLNWRAEKAYKEFGARVKAEAKKRNLFKDVKKFSKKQHKQRMEDSKLFSFVKEGNGERYVNLALSQGQTNTLVKAGVSLEEVGFTEFKETVMDILGSELQPWYLSYFVRYAIK